MAYFHSVRLDADKCIGCTNCIKCCPTEAIRVRRGKAVIIEDRCIDCGECIRVCPNHAKQAYTDSLSRLEDFAYNVALPAPSLFGQFPQLVGPGQVVAALLAIGFDKVFEVPVAADYVTRAVRSYIAEHGSGPWISTSCPAIVRLIQVRYPELLGHMVPVETPMEVAAILARRQAARVSGLDQSQIGVWFVTPCPAKVTAINQPEGRYSSSASGAFAIKDLYGDLVKQLYAADLKLQPSLASAWGLGWGRIGGENSAVGAGIRLAVDGVHSLISLFDEMERGKLNEIGFLECAACIGGCVGGPLTVENPFVARVRLLKQMEGLPTEQRSLAKDYPELDAEDLLVLRGSLEPRPIMPLARDIVSAAQRMEQLECLVSSLPGLDCGACGSPNCRALAEDIVRGNARESDCLIKLREKAKSPDRESSGSASRTSARRGGPSSEEGEHATEYDC